MDLEIMVWKNECHVCARISCQKKWKIRTKTLPYVFHIRENTSKTWIPSALIENAMKKAIIYRKMCFHWFNNCSANMGNSIKCTFLQCKRACFTAGGVVC